MENKDISIDVRGHDINTLHAEKNLLLKFNSFKRFLSEHPNIKGVTFNDFLPPEFRCNVCGDSVRFPTSDKKNFTAETECVYKNGFPPIEVKLNVPSGEILLFNDLRRFYPANTDGIDICTSIGIKQFTEAFAKEGLVIHFVGNSSPGVVQVNDERLEIGYFWCEKEDGCSLPECPMPECNRPKILGHICTDLWWYCAVDKDEFEKRIGKTTEEYQEEYHKTGAWPEIIRAKVTPGVYRTVGQYHIDSDKLFSYIERE
jgi:hypothetical protein